MERFLDYFVPENYKLDLVIDKFKKTIGGMVVIKGVAKAETVKFHVVSLKIKSVLVDDKKTDFLCEDDVLKITKVVLGKHEIKIEYDGKLNENMQGANCNNGNYQSKIKRIFGNGSRIGIR